MFVIVLEAPGIEVFLGLPIGITRDIITRDITHARQFATREEAEREAFLYATVKAHHSLMQAVRVEEYPDPPKL